MSIESNVQSVEQKAVQEANAVWAHLKFMQASWILVLVGVALVFGVVVYKGSKSYDAAITKANADNATLKGNTLALEAYWKGVQVQATQAKTQTQVIERTIQVRSDATKEAVAEATKPSTPQDVVKSYEHYYGGSIYANPDGNITVTVPQAQEAVAAKIENDSCQEDVADRVSELKLCNEVSSEYYTTLTKTQDALAESEKVIVDYKKAATKSKWQRLKGYAITAAIAYGAYEVGHLAK